MTQFDAQLRWLIHFHIQCDGSSMSDGGRYPAYDQSHSLQTHLWMWDVAIFPPVLCVFGEKKKLKLWWLSMTRLQAWLHHLSHETHQQRGFVGWVPSGRRWCQWTNPGACLIEKELSSGPCDSPWSLKLHTWLFPLCHHLMHYSLIWNCYQRFPALTVTRLTDHRNLRVPSHIMTFVTTCGRFLR